MSTTATLARKLRTIKDAAEYKAALIEAGAEESSAAMCATEARVEGFTGRMCVNHAAYCLKDSAALARDAGHAEKQLKRMGRPPLVEGDPRQKVTMTLRRSLIEHVQQQRGQGESLAACIDRLLSGSLKR